MLGSALSMFLESRLSFIRSKATVLTPFLMTGLSLTACGGGRGTPDMVVVDSAGVMVIDLPGADFPLNWTAEKVLELRPVEEEGEGFFGVTDVEVVAGNRIAVLDRMGKKVLFFDGEGRLLAQHGRQGSGPGEFQYPTELFTTPGGGVGVYDMMNRRLEQFDSSLSPIAPDPFQVPYYGGQIAYAGPFRVIPVADLTVETHEIEVISAIRGPDTVEVVRYAREEGGTVQLESCGMTLSGMAPLFAPRTRWAASPGGMVAVAGTLRYEIDLYRQPEFILERRIRRRVPVIVATEELARESLGDGMRMVGAGGERVCDAAEVVEKRGFSPEIPPVASLVISPAGEIFLERWAPEGEERSIDVLDLAGEYRGTLAPGFPFPTAFLGEDRIVVREEDDLGLTSVAVYRVSRG